MAKFRVTMKNPDAVYEAVDQAAIDEVDLIEGLSEEERSELCESKRSSINESISKWFEYEEYLTVEVDTESGTCVVVPVSA